MSREPLPIGRRVAYLRVRRRLSQQSFADRLGKSKSWVDKVERGVRSLERVSTIREIAAVLRVDPAALLGGDVQPAGSAERREGVARIRAALSAYPMAFCRPTDREVMSPDRLARGVRHAWMTFQHARYPRLVELLPTVVSEVHRAHVLDPESGRAAVVEAYRVTAALLVKLGEGSLAWLAADRAMSAAAGDRVLLACAAVQLGQVLRASARAGTVMLAAASQIAPGTPQELSLRGSLLVQAALIAAGAGDDRAVGELLDEAAKLGVQVGDGNDHHRTAFGPTAVELAQVAAAVELGDGSQAVARHEEAIGRDGWRWLPVEHRAAHLIDAARAYLQTDDPANAARVLLRAERIAPAEIHHRPAVRDVVAQVARDPDAPATITQLAFNLGVL
ncbi:transcriptional regulator with XRE-family HTH domain [Micromonospora vinacea]|uniref:Transcriptional regulator with XRE-family HTH domain n=1 Tax=Micromonospora vinacea TaxID=709878 RepID=A0ABS0JVW9_9ACTN|nr:helix-turn-helix domain-containing protein [Micromonospora vinacea]MBG6100504.1 transcriptional regulator with XRE-family HTH domain [Micromonospora vinacea]